MITLRAQRVFDGSRFVDPPLVTLDGDKIMSVGSARPPDGAEVIDLKGATVAPGLVDCHQHLCFEALSEASGSAPRDELTAQARRSAARALAAGVTTIRDLGDKDYAVADLRGDDAMPTILSSGPPITVPEGHCWYLGGEIDPRQGEAGLRDAVRERADRGCDVVKIMVTGGFLTPTNPMWRSQFTGDELGIVVDEAHRRGLPVAAHCHGIDGIESAVAARVDTIEHCSFLDEDLDVQVMCDVLALVAASKIPVSATLGRLPTVPMPPLLAKNLEAGMAARRRLLELGGLIVPGTDAGIGPAKPHDVLPHAFGDLVRAGYTPQQALSAMTRDGARACGLGAVKGRLEPGYDADLLALAGDPTDDVDAIHAPLAVWRSGRRAV